MISFPDKEEGDKLFASEINQLKKAINDQEDRVALIDDDALSAFGSVGSRLLALEKYVMLLTQHNKVLSATLKGALPGVFLTIVPDEEYKKAEEERDAAVLNAETLQNQYDQASEDSKASLQAELDNAIILASDKTLEVEELTPQSEVESDIDIASDRNGYYVGNQLLITWTIVGESEYVDQPLLDKYNLTKVVQESGESGVVGQGLYQMPKGTNALDVMQAIATEERLAYRSEGSNGESVGYPIANRITVSTAYGSATPSDVFIEKIALNRNIPDGALSHDSKFSLSMLELAFNRNVPLEMKQEILDKWKLDEPTPGETRGYRTVGSNTPLDSPYPMLRFYVIRDQWMHPETLKNEILKEHGGPRGSVRGVRLLYVNRAYGISEFFGDAAVNV